MLYSEAPASIYGLASRKGRRSAGADANLLLVDPATRWTISDQEILSRAGWSPYSGRTLTGRAVSTYVRGSSVMEDGELVAEPGHGRFLTPLPLPRG